MDAHVDLLSRLVAIDSVNPDLVPGGAGEARIVEFIAGWLKDAGLEVEVDEPRPGRPSVVATARGTGGGRSLLLNAHVDTVGVAGMQQPHVPRVEGNRLYGRGAYDMKCGLTAIMLAGARASREPLAGDVVITAVADEENASIGTASVLKRWRADAAIVTEPTSLRVCIAHKGFVWIDIATNGRAAHGSKPELGVDAIVKMAPILAGIEALDRKLRASRGHRLVGTGSVHASTIEGGQERSSYPARCVVAVERRTIPGETPELVREEVSDIIEQARLITPDLDAEFELGLAQGSFEVDPAEPVVESLLRQARLKLGTEPEVYGESFWMDAALLSAAGIPTVVFGPGGAGAHAVEEWADLDQLEACADILLATVIDFCGPALG
jgi:acetylornithine deacetylase